MDSDPLDHGLALRAIISKDLTYVKKEDEATSMGARAVGSMAFGNYMPSLKLLLSPDANMPSTITEQANSFLTYNLVTKQKKDSSGTDKNGIHGKSSDLTSSDLNDKNTKKLKALMALDSESERRKRWADRFAFMGEFWMQKLQYCKFTQGLQLAFEVPALYTAKHAGLGFYLPRSVFMSAFKSSIERNEKLVKVSEIDAFLNASFDCLDLNKSGSIDYREFLTIMSFFRLPTDVPASTILRSWYKAYGGDRTNGLTYPDFLKMITSFCISSEEVRRVFSFVNPDLVLEAIEAVHAKKTLVLPISHPLYRTTQFSRFKEGGDIVTVLDDSNAVESGTIIPQVLGVSNDQKGTLLDSSSSSSAGMTLSSVLQAAGEQVELARFRSIAENTRPLDYHDPSDVVDKDLSMSNGEKSASIVDTLMLLEKSGLRRGESPPDQELLTSLETEHRTAILKQLRDREEQQRLSDRMEAINNNYNDTLLSSLKQGSLHPPHLPPDYDNLPSRSEEDSRLRAAMEQADGYVSEREHRRRVYQIERYRHPLKSKRSNDSQVEKQLQIDRSRDDSESRLMLPPVSSSEVSSRGTHTLSELFAGPEESEDSEEEALRIGRAAMVAASDGPSDRGRRFAEVVIRVAKRIQDVPGLRLKLALLAVREAEKRKEGLALGGGLTLRSFARAWSLIDSSQAEYADNGALALTNGGQYSSRSSLRSLINSRRQQVPLRNQRAIGDGAASDTEGALAESSNRRGRSLLDNGSSSQRFSSLPVFPGGYSSSFPSSESSRVATSDSIPDGLTAVLSTMGPPTERVNSNANISSNSEHVEAQVLSIRVKSAAGSRGSSHTASPAVTPTGSPRAGPIVATGNSALLSALRASSSASNRSEAQILAAEDELVRAAMALWHPTSGLRRALPGLKKKIEKTEKEMRKERNKHIISHQAHQPGLMEVRLNMGRAVDRQAHRFDASEWSGRQSPRARGKGNTVLVAKSKSPRHSNAHSNSNGKSTPLMLTDQQPTGPVSSSGVFKELTDLERAAARQAILEADRLGTTVKKLERERRRQQRREQRKLDSSRVKSRSRSRQRSGVDSESLQSSPSSESDLDSDSSEEPVNLREWPLKFLEDEVERLTGVVNLARRKRRARVFETVTGNGGSDDDDDANVSSPKAGSKSNYMSLGPQPGSRAHLDLVLSPKNGLLHPLNTENGSELPRLSWNGMKYFLLRSPALCAEIERLRVLRTPAALRSMALATLAQRAKEDADAHLQAVRELNMNSQALKLLRLHILTRAMRGWKSFCTEAARVRRSTAALRKRRALSRWLARTRSNRLARAQTSLARTHYFVHLLHGAFRSWRSTVGMRARLAAAATARADAFRQHQLLSRGFNALHTAVLLSRARNHYLARLAVKHFSAWVLAVNIWRAERVRVDVAARIADKRLEGVRQEIAEEERVAMEQLEHEREAAALAEFEAAAAAAAEEARLQKMRDVAAARARRNQILAEQERARAERSAEKLRAFELSFQKQWAERLSNAIEAIVRETAEFCETPAGRQMLKESAKQLLLGNTVESVSQEGSDFSAVFRLSDGCIHFVRGEPAPLDLNLDSMRLREAVLVAHAHYLAKCKKKVEAEISFQKEGAWYSATREWSACILQRFARTIIARKQCQAQIASRLELLVESNGSIYYYDLWSGREFEGAGPGGKLRFFRGHVHPVPTHFAIRAPVGGSASASNTTTKLIGFASMLSPWTILEYPPQGLKLCAYCQADFVTRECPVAPCASTGSCFHCFAQHHGGYYGIRSPEWEQHWKRIRRIAVRSAQATQAAEEVARAKEEGVKKSRAGIQQAGRGQNGGHSNERLVQAYRRLSGFGK